MGHLNSHLLWKKYAEPYFKEGNKILEIGPAGYPTWFEAQLNAAGMVSDYQVLDVRSEFISNAVNNPKFILAADELNYPVNDHTYDIVFSDQVLAHVPYFWLWYAELTRIVKPGGHIITINSYSYPSCPSPIDAWRVHSDGMKALNKINGLDTILSLTESAEMAEHNIASRPGHYFPGASIADPFNTGSGKNLRINIARRNWNRVIGKIPGLRSVLLNPVQVSFDTITIAHKPL